MKQQIQKKARMDKKRTDIACFFTTSYGLTVFQSSLLKFVTFCIIAWEVYLFDRKLLFCRLRVISSLLNVNLHSA